MIGWMAEWSCSGLQLRERRFDSDPRLHICFARMMESVDIGDLKSPEGNFVPVQVRLRAPFTDRPIWYKKVCEAELAQLVERNLAKVQVVGSSPIFRSIYTPSFII